MTNIEIYNLINSDNELWKRFEIGFWKTLATKENAENEFRSLVDAYKTNPRSWVDSNRYNIMELLVKYKLGPDLKDESIDMVISNLIPFIKEKYSNEEIARVYEAKELALKNE